MSPTPAGAQLNKPGIDRECSAQPHADRESSLVWSLTPQQEEITSNGAWPSFHLSSTAWRWGTRRSGLWGSKLGEPCPVWGQCVQRPTPRRLVVQDRRALGCPEFGQRRWPFALCLLQDCDSPSLPGPTGKLAVDVHAGSVCARAEVAWLWGAPCCPVCAVHTLGCKSLRQHDFTTGQGHCLQLCWVLVPFWRRVLPHGVSQPSGHPPSTPGHLTGSWSLWLSPGQGHLCPEVTMAACLPAEYPQGPVPTLWNEPPELPSGAGPFDAATTTAQPSDATAFPPYTSELEPEDTTHLHRMDAGDGTWLHHGHWTSVLCICSLCHLPGGV